jgi:hypothetical protein
MANQEKGAIVFDFTEEKAYRKKSSRIGNVLSRLRAIGRTQSPKVIKRVEGLPPEVLGMRMPEGNMEDRPPQTEAEASRARHISVPLSRFERRGREIGRKDESQGRTEEQEIAEEGAQ